MSKTIKWQIPFVSTIDKIRYRIDIYAEGYTGTPIQLTGGTNPIKTEENKSDDFFAPVRGQTGTIEVVTKLPNGGTLDINDMLPSDNIDHPVRLVSISGSTETIEWQGFMSCEAFSQNYTSVPDTFSFPIISVLEAMGSVEIDATKLSGLNNVGTTINQLLEIFIEEAGVSYFNEYYVPSIARGRNILSKYIDSTVFFEQKEYNNENSTTYIVSGLSIQDCLKRIAVYMGWCLRENSYTLYFMAANETASYNRRLRQVQIKPGGHVIITWMPDLNNTPITIIDIASFRWRGTDHKRSIAQGAKSVEVVAKIEQNDFSIGLPDFPFGNTSNLEWQNGIKYKSNTSKYIYIQLNYNNDAYNNNYYAYYAGNLTRTGDHDYSATFIGKSTKENFLARLSLFPQANQKFISENPQIAGAILIRYEITDEQTDTHNLKSGLYCPLLPGQYGRDIPVYKMWTLKPSVFYDGKFILKADMLFNALYRYNSLNQQIMSDEVGDNYVDCPNENMTLALKVGDKYWNGSEWTETRSPFPALLKDKGMEIEIPVTSYLTGAVTLEIWGGITVGGNVNTLYEVIFNSLEIGFEFNHDYMATDRSENHYFRLLGTNFRDEISVNTDLASMLNNQPSPSLIMNSENEAMTELNYGTVQSPDMRRPEIDLLNRLATYYSAARQRLSLIVAHPTAAPLPLLRLNGIIPDTRKYLPLAESREWINDTSTLTCFETTNNE